MTTEIWTARGRTAAAIPAVLGQLTSLGPEWIWLEPRPGCGLDDNGKPYAGITAADLHPLLRRANAMPTLDPRLALDEARLFWPTASLHLLHDRNRTRWSFWAVQSGLTQDMRATIRTLAIECESTTGLDEGKSETLLTRQDFRRFGLPSKHDMLPKRLGLRTYRSKGAIAAWTLVTTETR